MNRNRLSILSTAAIVVFALTGWAWPDAALALDSAQALFRDASGDRIRSDGEGAYIDINIAGDCVRAYVSNTGNAFMRTGGGNTFSGGFSTCVPGNARNLFLDFSDIEPPAACALPAPLVCGANSIPDAKILAGGAFKANTTASMVTVDFNLDSAFPNATYQFSLAFEQALSVTVGLTNEERVLTAAAGAVAELYENVKVGKRTTKVSHGRFRMPLQMTFTRLP